MLNKKKKKRKAFTIQTQEETDKLYQVFKQTGK